MTKANHENSRIKKAKLLIQGGRFDQAIKILSNNEYQSPEEKALIGLSHFLNKEYEVAADYYQEALSNVPDHMEWKTMLERSLSNAHAEIHEFVPSIYYFEKDKLLSFPEITDADLPAPLGQKFRIGNWRITRTIIGNGLGYMLTVILEVTTFFWGKIMGYRDKIWTNWYRRPVFFGILTLAYMRDILNRNSLISSYPEDVLVGFVKDDIALPKGVTHFRTPDGSWNNLKNPKEGSAGTRFMRNATAQAIQKEMSNDLLDPNPRELSRILLTRVDQMIEAPFMNILGVAWVQFQTHDWVSHGETLNQEIIEIPILENDPIRKRYHQTKMFVGRTQKDITRCLNDKLPLTFINEVTHWWDGSQIYGSDKTTLQTLRKGKNGKMKLNVQGTLPLDKNGIEKTGFVRNWWVGLSLLHTLFVKEHNSICDLLITLHPEWDDNRLFQVARLINAALMAKIHTLEWNSAINPNKGIYKGNHTNWYGYLTTLRKKKNWKTVADINVRNTELGGVVGNPINKHGSPFGLTQEFVEAYRLHNLLPEVINIRNNNGQKGSSIPLPMTRQSGSAKLIDKYGIPTLLASFGVQNAGQFVLNNYPKFMQELSIPGNPIYDLGAVDILRARERGVPRYNEFRRQLGLVPLKSFEELTPNQEHLQKLKKIYRNDIEKLDMLIGTMAEDKRPTGFALGETQFQLFLLNATRRLQTDRFFTDCYSEKYYTAEGLEWIDSNNLKSVILRHFPELESTGLGNITNAFEPWDNEKHLDPQRHPLRAFDPDTKNDPWIGDRYKSKY